MDTTLIEGYDTMTPEEKLAALEGFEFKPDYSGYVKKSVLDKAASEAADYKRQLREKQSAEEIAEMERQAKVQEFQDKYADLEAKYAELQKANTVNAYKSQLIGLGYETKLADATARAMADGDMATVFANQAKFMAERERAAKADALKGMSGPKGGASEDDGDAGTDAVAIARRIGKAKAEAGSSTSSILDRYTLK